MLSEKREKFVLRMIKIYGVENPLTRAFCKLCEQYENTDKYDTILQMYLESHEKPPIIF